MGIISKLVTKGIKTGRPYGKPSLVNKDGTKNRNYYIPNLSGKQAIEDLTKIKKAVKSSTAKGAARASEKEAGVRAASRTAMRAAPLATAAGAAASLTTKEKKKEDKKQETKKETKNTTSMSKDERANKADYPVYKKGTESSKAFKDAFAKAKDDKKATFTFEGRKYSTKEK